MKFINKHLHKFMIASLLTSTSFVFASELDDGKGWYFYKEPIEKEVEKPKPVPKEVEKPKPVEKKKEELPPKVEYIYIPPPSTEKEVEPPKAGSVLWYKENLEDYKNKAIENPTPENIRNYALFQEAVKHKSDVFSDRYKDFYMQNPQLVAPTSQFHVNQAKEQQAKVRKGAMNELKDKVGILYFFESTCPYCKQMSQTTIARLIADGFSVKGISIDGRGLPNSPFESDFDVATPQQLKQLSILRVPTTYTYHPKKGLAITTVGMSSFDDFRKRLIFVGSEMGLVSKSKYKTADSFQNEQKPKLLPDNFEPESPEDVVNALKQKLRIKDS